jgi:hypothetical protein
MGEVVIADNTLTGDGVVLAQRLEQLAESGGVCIQDAAYQSIPKRFPFEYEDLGEQELKGFEDPVRIHAITLRSGASIPFVQRHIWSAPRLQGEVSGMAQRRRCIHISVYGLLPFCKGPF